MLTGMRRAHLRADARLTLRHHRIEETGDIDAFLQQTSGHGLRLLGVVDHHRHDRMHARLDVETGGTHLLAEIAGVVLEPVAQIVGTGEHVEHLDRGGDDVRW